MNGSRITQNSSLAGEGFIQSVNFLSRVRYGYPYDYAFATDMNDAEVQRGFEMATRWQIARKGQS
jgi:hypothetical protein